MINFSEAYEKVSQGTFSKETDVDEIINTIKSCDPEDPEAKAFLKLTTERFQKLLNSLKRSDSNRITIKDGDMPIPIRILKFQSVIQICEEANTVKASPKANTNEESEKRAPVQYTKARQLLALYFILNALGIEEHLVNKTDIAKLAHLLAGMDPPERIANSSLYEHAKKLFQKHDKQNAQDLKFILDHFRKLSTEGSSGLNEVISLIEKDIQEE